MHEYVTSSRPKILVTALAAVLVVAAIKYGMVGLMLYEGMSRTKLRLQDSLTAGLLAGLVVWLALAAAHLRQRQIGERVQTVADLNHHLRNALNIILNSHYLKGHEQKEAILESVDRIDRALQQIVPSKRARTGRKVGHIPTVQDEDPAEDTLAG